MAAESCYDAGCASAQPANAAPADALDLPTLDPPTLDPPTMSPPASQLPISQEGLHPLLARLVKVEKAEVAALLYSFAYFCAILTAYYIIRPLRDEMGVALGQHGLTNTFTIVFFVMVAAVPVFGWIVSNVPRRLIIAVVYAFFALNLVLFWLVFKTWGIGPRQAGAFFVWASVFNLFLVSLFWSLMSELWSSAQAKRLYGFIAAGGSTGALVGPLVTRTLAPHVGTDNLLLVAAVFLVLAILVAAKLRHLLATGDTASAEHPTGRDILAGAVGVWKSPYLFRIALWVLLANLVSTYFYLEQSRIVGEAITDRAERVKLFSSLDLTVNILTIALQMLVTGRVMQRYGVAVAAAALPTVACLGLVALSIAPGLAVVAGVMVIERAVAFALASPAVRVLWTVVDPEAKYKAQSFVDTVVYRGGDAASGWMLAQLGTAGLGLAPPAIALVTLPLGIAWLALTFVLGRLLAARTAMVETRASA